MVYGIVKITTKHKHTILYIEDKITICECLDKGSFKREIACEYKITVFIYFMHICLIIQTFEYLNKLWSLYIHRHITHTYIHEHISTYTNT